MAGDPIPTFEPASYPGPRPPGPTLVHHGRAYPLHLDVDTAPHVHAEVAAPVLEAGMVRWVVAYGSNASPGRLVDKRVDRRGALLLPAVLDGYVTAFEGRVTGYGSVPVTLVPSTGVRTPTWVLGVHVDDTPTLDRSEGRLLDDTLDVSGPSVRGDLRRAPPGAYRLGHVGEVVVARALVLDDALAYLPGVRTAVQADERGAWRTWPDVDQVAAAAHVEAGGPLAAAPAPHHPVRGPWPTTPLRPLLPPRG